MIVALPNRLWCRSMFIVSFVRLPVGVIYWAELSVFLCGLLLVVRGFYFLHSRSQRFGSWEFTPRWFYISLIVFSLSEVIQGYPSCIVVWPGRIVPNSFLSRWKMYRMWFVVYERLACSTVYINYLSLFLEQACHQEHFIGVKDILSVRSFEFSVELRGLKWGKSLLASPR